MKILALDPGEETGYAIIETEGDNIKTSDYGVIPVIHPGLDGLLFSVWQWLEINHSDCFIVFEDFIPSMRLKTTKESVEVRGIIRLFCFLYSSKLWASYYPATVRNQLGVKNKAEARKLVEQILGFKVRGKDHVPDAIAVGMAHAIKVGAWIAHIDLSNQEKPSKVQRRGKDINPDNMSNQEIVEAIQRGDIKVGSKR